jgi:hypothetical protein
MPRRHRISRLNPETGERESVVIPFTAAEETAKDAEEARSRLDDTEAARLEQVRLGGLAKIHAASGLTDEEIAVQRN